MKCNGSRISGLGRKNLCPSTMRTKRTACLSLRYLRSCWCRVYEWMCLLWVWRSWRCSLCPWTFWFGSGWTYSLLPAGLKTKVQTGWKILFLGKILKGKDIKQIIFWISILQVSDFVIFRGRKYELKKQTNKQKCWSHVADSCYWMCCHGVFSLLDWN